MSLGRLWARFESLPGDKREREREKEKLRLILTPFLPRAFQQCAEMRFISAAHTYVTYEKEIYRCEREGELVVYVIYFFLSSLFVINGVSSVSESLR